MRIVLMQLKRFLIAFILKNKVINLNWIIIRNSNLYKGYKGRSCLTYKNICNVQMSYMTYIV